MTTKKETAIATVEENQYAVVVSGANCGELINENLGGQFSIFDLDIVKVPAAGGIAWEIPTMEGTESSKDVTGVIIGKKRVRAYFDKPFDGSSEPPACSSNDGEIGIGDPCNSGMAGRHSCETCPMNQWGTDPNPQGSGKGKACSEKLMLFILRKDELLPTVLVVPPTSLKPLRKYMLRLSGKGKAFYTVETTFSLAKTKNATGIAYSEVVPTMSRELSPQEAEVMKTYYTGFGELLEGVTVPVEVHEQSQADE